MNVYSITEGELSHASKEIADLLGLTLKTVRNHVSNIFSKLQVADWTQAILHAREAGLEQEQSQEKAGRPFQNGCLLFRNDIQFNTSKATDIFTNIL
jgi:hypothetical protein